MKKIFSILTLLGLLFSSTTIIGQHQAVSFDYEKASFNNNQPLPAESHILVQGDVPKNVTIIELSVFDGKGREDRKPFCGKNLSTKKPSVLTFLSITN